MPFAQAAAILATHRRSDKQHATNTPIATRFVTADEYEAFQMRGQGWTEVNLVKSIRTALQ